jgi:hypothetical protein
VAHAQYINKMVAVLTECTTYCCPFLCATGLSAEDIHKEVFPVYADKCLSRKAVNSWLEKCSQGRSKI